MDCVFCKIIAGGIPNFTVYEDEASLAFLDINPHAKGHTVVIPKNHRESLDDIGDEEFVSLMRAVKKTAGKLNDKMSPDGLNIGWNDLPAAGQAVPHMHIHILPRYKRDGGGSMHSIVKNDGGTSVEAVHSLLQ